jgi:hypothetical protein
MTMRRWRGLGAMLLAAGCADAPPPAPAPPQPAAPQAAPTVATPPVPDVTRRYDILLQGRVAGTSVITKHADLSCDEDYELNDRGRGPKTHAHVDLGPAGVPSRFELSGKDYLKRDVHELATCDASRCKWDSNDEHGEGAAGFYVPMNSAIVLDGALLRAALASSEGIRLLPGGTLRAAKVADATVSHGGATKHVVAYELAGFGLFPAYEWFEDDGTPFAVAADWQSWVLEGWDEAVPTLLGLQRPLGLAWRARVVRDVTHRPPSLAVVHARLFDPASRRVVEDATIVIENGKVKAVGPKLDAPKGAEIISAQGRFVLPGLWDMHVHTDDNDGLLELSEGITTVRDLGNDMDPAMSRRERWDGVVDPGPHLLLAGLVDGRGPFQAPTKVLADTPEEAVAVVDRFAKSGYLQLKIYSSVKPELVPFLVKEAHARKMRVSGHVPAHMIAQDAVNAGFDELQHLNFVMLDLISTREDDTRTPFRFTRVAEAGADLDLDAPPAKALFDLLVRKHTVVDPTINFLEQMLTIRPDHPDPNVAPLLSRLPPQVQRQAFLGVLPVPDGKDARYRASFAKCMALLKRLWDRKITIVAGTDSWAGLALHHELELYAQAGIPNADVLALATLGAARVMKRDGTTGSLAPGKDADLVMVDGDPLSNMGDIRNVVTVVKGGMVLDAVAAQKAMSIAPRRAP